MQADAHGASVDATIERISSYKGVLGCVVVTASGKLLRSTLPEVRASRAAVGGGRGRPRRWRAMGSRLAGRRAARRAGPTACCTKCWGTGWGNSAVRYTTRRSLHPPQQALADELVRVAPPLAEVCRAAVREMDPQNDLKIVRLRTAKKREVMVVYGERRRRCSASLCSLLTERARRAAAARDQPRCFPWLPATHRPRVPGHRAPGQQPRRRLTQKVTPATARRERLWYRTA